MNENASHKIHLSVPDKLMPGRCLPKNMKREGVLGELLGHVLWMTEHGDMSDTKTEIATLISRLWADPCPAKYVPQERLILIRNGFKNMIGENELLVMIADIASRENTVAEQRLLPLSVLAYLHLINLGKYRSSLTDGTRRFRTYRGHNSNMRFVYSDATSLRGMRGEIQKIVNNGAGVLGPVHRLLNDAIEEHDKIQRGKTFKFDNEQDVDDGFRYRPGLDLKRVKRLRGKLQKGEELEIDDYGARDFSLVWDKTGSDAASVDRRYSFSSNSQSRRVYEAKQKANSGCPIGKQYPTDQTVAKVLAELNSDALKNDPGATLVLLGITTPLSVESWCQLLSNRTWRHHIEKLEDGRLLLNLDAGCPNLKSSDDNNLYFPTKDKLCWPILPLLSSGLKDLISAASGHRWSAKYFQELANKSLKTCTVKFRLKNLRRRLGRYFQNWLERTDFSQHGFKTKSIDSALSAVLLGKGKTDNPQVFYSINAQDIVFSLYDKFVYCLSTLSGVEFQEFGDVQDLAGLYAGSHRVVRRKQVSAYMQVLIESLGQATHQPLVYTSRLALLVYEVATLAMAWRARDDRLFSIKCVDLIGRTVRISDKRIRGSASDRILPMGEILYAFLTLWNDHLNFMHEHYQYSETSIAEACKLAVDENRAALSLPSIGLVELSPAYLFVFVESSLVKQPLKCASVRDCHMQHDFCPVMNWNRHFVRAYLEACGVESHIIDAYLGHPQRGSLSHDRHSAFSWAQHPGFARIIDKMLLSLGVDVAQVPRLSLESA